MKQRLLPIAIGLWLCSVSAGLFGFARYQLCPADIQNADASEPQVKSIVRIDGAPTVVMFLHPQCPCSRASLSELERVLARARHVSVNVVALQYGDLWTNSELLSIAKRIPGVNIVHDEDGAIAREFGASTSGELFAYSAGGATLFHGGVTAARGHAGDNLGSAALQTALAGQMKERFRGPVFGCPLFAAGTKKP